MTAVSLTIGRWLSDRARNTPARIAIESAERRLTYGELEARSLAFAIDLNRRGLQRGDRLATLTGNSPEHVAILFACARLGIVLQPVSWRLAAAEVEYQLRDAEPSLLVVSDEHEALARDSRPAMPVVSLAELDAASSREGGPEPEDVAEDDDGLLLVYTSGTTGRPKGALITHANCFWANLAFDRTSGIHEDDIVLQVLPQFHVGGWNVQPLLAWWKGATVVLEPAFDSARALRLIAERGVTTMMGVPATYLFLAEEPGFGDADLSSLRLAVVGGAPMPESLLETWLERGVPIVQGYGLTEASPNVLCLPPEDARRKLGFAGRPYPHVDVALRDETTGAVVVGPGRGELLVRGPNVFPGYWRNPAATREVLVDGWLRTGDIAERDAEGDHRIVGRLKELVISGGENVYPAEVEDVLHAHAAVAEAAVIGVPDPRWGEACVAFVVIRPDAGADADELVAWCRDRLARFKIPREVRLVDRLPRSGMGKVVKDDLRELYGEPVT